MNDKFMHATRIGIVLAFVVWAFPPPAFSMHVWNTDLRQMTSDADAIYYGEVVGQKVYFDTARGSVLTEVEMTVLESPKESGMTKNRVRFLIPGGLFEGVLWDGPGFPKFKSGEKAMIFMDDVSGRLWPYGLPLGTFQQSSTAGVLRLERDLRDAHVTDLADPSREIPSKLEYFEFNGFKKKVMEYLGKAAPQEALPSLEERYRSADAVLTGRVRSVRFSADAARIVVTRIVVEPFQILKGVPQQDWVIEIEGGELPDVKYETYDRPSFSENEQALIFLKRTASGFTPIGAEGKVSGRRKSDGRFELLLEDGRRIFLDEVTFTDR